MGSTLVMREIRLCLHFTILQTLSVLLILTLTFFSVALKLVCLCCFGNTVHKHNEHLVHEKEFIDLVTLPPYMTCYTATAGL